jgi:hypothetical protein
MRVLSNGAFLGMRAGRLIVRSGFIRAHRHRADAGYRLNYSVIAGA